VNARPHLGHAYTTIAADVLARWHRAQGDDTWFLTGTDEHGQKIQRSAKSRGMSPQALVDEVAGEFRGLWDRMGLTYDDFIRTTEPRHKRGVQKLFTLLKERGYIYKGTYSGQYCVFDELYVDTPPGVPCPDCGRPTETISEENYYFKLSEFQEPLLKYYDEHPEFIQPEARRNEVAAFVRGGLRDLSVSRTSFDWGIPVPGDEKHVIYVWLDALANYITALGWGSDDDAKFKKYWPAQLHLIGKEISRFHCVYWPAFLMAAGLPLPKQIVAHGWLLFEQSKMSKSRGNIVRAETILDVLGNDALRYFLLREIVFGQDGSFSFDALVERYNADLANGYGNLASRVLTMIEKYCDGWVPRNVLNSAVPLPGIPADLQQMVNAHIEAHDFSRALELIWESIARVDQAISSAKPWELAKRQEHDQLQSLLYVCAECVRYITGLVYPFIPEGAGKVWAQLGLGDIAEAAKRGELRDWQWGGLKHGTKLGAIAPVFPRAEKDTVNRMQEMEEKKNAVPASGPADTAAAKPATPVASAAPAAGASAPEKITIDDFTKVELRVAQVKFAERVPNADRLLRIEVDLGYETRQIVAGIAEVYSPEQLIGRKVVIVANLAPRKLRGLESNGMIVAASVGEKGSPVLAGFLEDVEIGARLK
jgi:methionyl-tRNA synthetase